MSDKAISDYRDLEVWKKSMRLTTQVYEVTDQLPKSEIFGLTAQVRRAAVSVPANIAEGNARGSRKDYRRHLLISRGSLAELDTHLLLCRSLGYLTADPLRSLSEDLRVISRMLTSLIAALK